MSDDQVVGADALTPQQIGGATKRARNREKLINAAAYVMKEDERGIAASVNDICVDAGVSSATFYTFYKSRNELCADAVGELITRPMIGNRYRNTAAAAIDEFYRLAKGRQNLLAAALCHRYETAPPCIEHHAPPPTGLDFTESETFGTRYVLLTEAATFIDEFAYTLATDDTYAILRAMQPPRREASNEPLKMFADAFADLEWKSSTEQFIHALRATAVYVMDRFAMACPVSTHDASRILLAACKRS